MVSVALHVSVDGRAFGWPQHCADAGAGNALVAIHIEVDRSGISAGVQTIPNNATTGRHCSSDHLIDCGCANGREFDDALAAHDANSSPGQEAAKERAQT